MHYDFAIWLNRSKELNPKLGSREEIARHEAQHVFAMRARLNKIIDDAKEWPDLFPTVEAQEAADKHGRDIEELFTKAVRKEADHETSDGFGTPEAETPIEPGTDPPPAPSDP